MRRSPRKAAVTATSTTGLPGSVSEEERRESLVRLLRAHGPETVENLQAMGFDAMTISGLWTRCVVRIEGERDAEKASSLGFRPGARVTLNDDAL